ncbi:hypothetical protein Vretimale_9426 [Volvox reticuliferus]|uniref:Mediator complex subunit 15 KIX domain-containing protein n=1 Tax=Volvox reticuliferus TaxID=1737510 RepID=A0A8J4GDF5_9CHLO|nr:hypothetical protein Vretimale_9426 [Volvox reticuliferus]
MHPTGDLALVTEGKRITLIKKIVEELKNIATDGGEDIGKDVQRTVVQLELDVYNSATSMGEYFNALGTRTTRLRTQLLQTAARAAGNTVAAVAAATTEPDAEEEVGGAHVVPGRGPVAQLLSDQPTRPQVGAQALNQSPSQPQQQPLHQHLQQPETAQTLQQQQQQQQGLQQQEQPQGAVGGMEGEVEEKGSHSTEGSCTVAIGRNGGSAAAATAVGVVSGAAGTPGRGPIQQMHMSNPAAEVVPYETLRLPGQDPASINEVANGARDPDAAVTTPESFGPAGPYGGAIGGPGTGLVPETGVHAAGGGIVFLYFSTSPRDEARRGDSGDRSSSGSGSVSFKPIPSELEPSQQQQPQPGPGPARLLPSHEFTGDRGEVGEFGGSGDGRDGEGDATRKLVQSQGATTSSWPQSAAMPPALHGTRHLAVVPSAEKLSVPVTTEWGGGSVQQGTTERLPPHHTPTVNDHATLPPQQLPPQLPQQQDVGEGQLLRTSSLTKAYLRLRPRAYQTASAGGAGLRDESGYINGPFECLTSTAGPLGPILRTASSPARAMDWLQPKQHQHQQQESLPLTQYGVPNRPRLEPSSQSDGAGATAQLQLRRRVSGSGDGRGGDRADVEDPTLPRVPYTFIRHASDSQVLAAREEQGYERWHGLTSREHRLGQPVLRLQPLRRSSSEVSPDGGAVRSKARTQVPVGRPSEAAVTAPAYGSSGGDCILELARLEGVLEGMQGPGSKVMPVAAVAATAMMTAPSPAAPPPRVPQATASFLGNSESAMVTSGPDILNVDTDMVDAFGCRGPPVAPAAPVPPPHTGPKSQLGPPGAHSFLGPTPQPMEPPSANRRLPDGPHQQVLLQQQQRLCLYPQQQGHNLQEQQHEAQQQRMEQLRFQQQQESRKASTLTSRDDFRQSLLPLQHRPSPSAGHTLSAEYSLIHSGSAHGAGDHPGAFPQHQHQHQHRHRHRHQAEPSGLAPQLAALGNIWQPPSQPLPPPPQQQQEQLQQQQRLHQPQPGIEPHLEIRPAAGQRQTQLTQQPVHGQFPPLQLQQLLPAQQPSQVQHQQHHQSSQPHYSQTQQVAPGTFPVPPRRAKSPRASLEIRSPAMSALQLSLIGTTNGGGGGTRGSDGGGGGLGGRDSGVIPGNAVLHSSTSQMQGQGQRPLPPWSAGTLGAAVGTSAPGGGDAVFNIDQLVVRQ